MTRATRAAEKATHDFHEAHEHEPKAVAAAPERVSPEVYRRLATEADTGLASALGSVGAAYRAQNDNERAEHLQAATVAIGGARMAIMRIMEHS